jgi:bifunctional UDP-N-acetylglucosamine pyrophosphorylase/glucosamine-1-phosphate N-acetyltransferase
MFANSQIGRLSFIGDSVIGENVDIGTGTVTVNRRLDFSPVWVKFGDFERDTHLTKLGSFIGDNVTIGASNTIMPGTIIEPNTVIPSCYSYPKK